MSLVYRTQYEEGRTYFLAVDKIGDSYRGHDPTNSYNLTLTLNLDQVDFLWRSWGIEGSALRFFTEKDRRDRFGFVHYRIAPRKQDFPFGDYITLRKLEGHIEDSSFERGETYNIWNKDKGREYLLFAVEGKNKEVKDLEGKVNLAYYAARENAYITPVSDELLLRTRLVPADEIGAAGIFRNYYLQDNHVILPTALERFSNECIRSEEEYKNKIRRYLRISPGTVEDFKREKLTKRIFRRPKVEEEIVPAYAVETVETMGHTLCAVVRGPFAFSPDEISGTKSKSERPQVGFRDYDHFISGSRKMKPYIPPKDT